MQNEQSKQTKKLSPRAIAIIILCSIAAVAAIILSVTGLGAKIADAYVASGRKDGFDLSTYVVKIAPSKLSDDVREMASTGSGRDGLTKPFTSMEDCVDFIGLSTLKIPEWDLKEEQCTLSVIANDAGEIEMLTIETDYADGDVVLQTFCEIYTDLFKGEINFEVRADDSVKTTKERSTNSRGIRYITLRSTDKKRDVRTTDAMLVDKGVVYALHCVYKAQEKPMAISEARLHEWAQQFGG